MAHGVSIILNAQNKTLHYNTTFAVTSSRTSRALHKVHSISTILQHMLKLINSKNHTISLFQNCSYCNIIFVVSSSRLCRAQSSVSDPDLDYIRIRNQEILTANEGPMRIQYKCLVPIYVFSEMKLCSLLITKREL
jgi:hypothetical protein